MTEIITIENDSKDVLRQRAVKVADPTSPEMRTLAAEMIQMMRIADGVGLAAPQIGRSVRLFVTENEGRVSIFFNPVITSYSEEKASSEEGCLSVPNMYYMIDRSRSITMEYQDIEGKKLELIVSGFFAYVLQHEYDHLDGTLIVDRFARQQLSK
jgi:peptide deformylase